MFERILLLSASAGAGHSRAADALAEAFRSGAGPAQVCHIDALQYTSRLYSALYTRGNTYVIRRLPWLARGLYRGLDSPGHTERFRTAIDRLNARPLVARLEDYQPDLVVCTHFLPAGIVSSLRRTNHIRPRLATVVTDYHVHGMWLTRNTDHYFVAGELARSHLVDAGVGAERVTAAGIPISTAFGAPMDRRELRHKYGITSEAPVILISAGRIGFEGVRAVADVMVRLKRKLQAILLCGFDTALKQRLDQYVRFEHRESAVTLHVFGHTGEMHEMMAVSDIIVGRPGGLMVAEALASGLAFFIVGRLPGQEEWNAQYLVDEGAGVRCTDHAMLHRQLAAVLDRPDRLESMKLRARRVARPRAACDIVRTILGWNS